MVHGLHVVAVGVAQEHAVVAGVILGELPRGVQHLHACAHRGGVDGVDGGAVGSAKRHVELPGLVACGWAQPEVGDALGAGQADDDTSRHREAHHLVQADGCENPHVERQRRFDIGHLDTNVIEHGRDGSTNRPGHVRR